MNSIDTFINSYFSLVRTSELTSLMYLLTIFFDVSVYTFYIFILTTIFISLTSTYKHAILFASAIFFTGILVYLMKVYFSVARPEDALVQVFGHSFPSFHATIATVFFAIIMYIFDKYLSPHLRIVFNSFSVFAILVVSFSRIYLGVHWFSDVFFGVLLGVIISYFFIIIFRFVINMQGGTSVVK